MVRWVWQRKESGHMEVSTEDTQSEKQGKEHEHTQRRTIMEEKGT